MIPDNERGTASTRWVMAREKISPAPQARAQRPRRGHRWIGCYPWPREQKITLVVKWRGGAEGWYLVQARGRSGVFPGVAALHDVMREIYQR